MSTYMLLRNAPTSHVSADMGVGFALSLLVHAVLVLALTVSLNWRSRTPEAIEAELWATVPQVAAPRVTAPKTVRDKSPKTKSVVKVPPQRRSHDADIATEAKRRAALKRRETKRKRAALRKKRAENARLAVQRQENLRRIMGQARATGQSTRSVGPSASYAGRIKARIKPNIVYTDLVVGNLLTEVEVRNAPNGAILSRKIVKSSGKGAWDDAVLRAIDKTKTLPRDVDGRVPPTLIIGFNPRDL